MAKRRKAPVTVYLKPSVKDELFALADGLPVQRAHFLGTALVAGAYLMASVYTKLGSDDPAFIDGMIAAFKGSGQVGIDLFAVSGEEEE